ncbi:MAG: low molecular weight phosphatase family protein [Alphaproteobacteria bacterium TMED89]|nr:low molecular weight phosphatase family protein [Rhodospirillaceae bacterium]RPH20184.1 MAG: low molecular weight phosphatase family protein [Alphaproteobacteria bacterium TMED89]
MSTLPGSVLFLCTRNAIRSPLAEGLMKDELLRAGRTGVFAASAGLYPTDIDGFVVSVLGEQGIDMHRHQSRPFDVHSDGGYDLIIALSKQAEGEALNAMRAQATEVEGWDVLDPSLVDGTRDMKLDAYRETRDQIRAKIKERFDFS